MSSEHVMLADGIRRRPFVFQSGRVRSSRLPAQAAEFVVLVLLLKVAAEKHIFCADMIGRSAEYAVFIDSQRIVNELHKTQRRRKAE